MTPDRRRCAPASTLVTALGALAISACASPDAGSDERPTARGPAPTEPTEFEFTQVVPGVYHARGAGAMSVGANAGIVVNDDDVLLVDSHISPAAADALLEDLRTITDKPVRFVANTHWHFDHAHGNQVYPAEVEIISHEASRAAIAAGRSKSGRTYDLFTAGIPDQIAGMEAALDTLADASARSELEAELESLKTYHAQLQEVVPTPPNTTLSERLTLFRGGREIRFLFFGRAHTEGDVVVYLPDDGVLLTGDMLTAGLPYMGDGFVHEWIDTLERLKTLDFEWIIPGHGPPYQDRARIDHLQDYLRDLWNQTVSFHERGQSADEALAAIDLTAHADHFDGITGTGANPAAVRRIYDLLDGTAN